MARHFRRARPQTGAICCSAIGADPATALSGMLPIRRSGRNDVRWFFAARPGDVTCETMIGGAANAEIVLEATSI